MYCKTHEISGSVVLACCDKEVLGKTLTEGDIEATISEKFYGKEKTSEQAFLELLGRAGNINLFGNKTVSIAVKHGFLSEGKARKIRGISHAIILKV